jgi:hypothetical protein
LIAEIKNFLAKAGLIWTIITVCKSLTILPGVEVKYSLKSFAITFGSSIIEPLCSIFDIGLNKVLFLLKVMSSEN